MSAETSAAACAEFPNDNPALHRGAIWRCVALGAPASSELPEPGVLAEQEPRGLTEPSALGEPGPSVPRVLVAPALEALLHAPRRDEASEVPSPSLPLDLDVHAQGDIQQAPPQAPPVAFESDETELESPDEPATFKEELGSGTFLVAPMAAPAFTTLSDDANVELGAEDLDDDLADEDPHDIEIVDELVFEGDMEEERPRCASPTGRISSRGRRRTSPRPLR